MPHFMIGLIVVFCFFVFLFSFLFVLLFFFLFFFLFVCFLFLFFVFFLLFFLTFLDNEISFFRNMEPLIQLNLYLFDVRRE